MFMRRCSSTRGGGAGCFSQARQTWSLALLSCSILSLSRSRLIPEPSFPSSSLSAFLLLVLFLEGAASEAVEPSSLVLFLPGQEEGGSAATVGSSSAAEPEVPSGGRFTFRRGCVFRGSVGVDTSLLSERGGHHLERDWGRSTTFSFTTFYYTFLQACETLRRRHCRPLVNRARANVRGGDWERGP